MLLNDLKDEYSDKKHDRPNVVGSKRQLKKEHGNIGWMVAKYLRYMASQYNYSNSIGNWPSQRNSYGNVPRNDTAESITPVEDMLRNYRYYLGLQGSGPNAYMTEAAEGEELPPVYTNGNEIYTVVQHMVGPVIKSVAGMTVTVESQDPSVQSVKQRRVAAITAKRDLPEIFKAFASMGVEYAPERRFAKDIDTALQEAMRAPSHKVERYGLDVLNHVNNVTSFKDLVPKAFFDSQVGGHTALHVDCSNPRIFLDKIRPWMTVFDRNEDDDYNKRSLFKGFVQYLSREEIYQSFDLSADEKDELETIFSKGPSAVSEYPSLFPDYARYTGFNWIDERDYRRIACITGYFIATITPQEGEPYHTLYQGTLIGNCILKSMWGEGNWEHRNIVYSMDDPSWPEIPIWIFSPDTILGTNVSTVRRFRQMQDDCDAYLFKIRQLISRDLGKNYMFNGAMIGNKTAREIIENFKNHGVDVSNFSTGEEPIAQNGRLVELVDMSMDPNVKAYVELRNVMRQDMMDVVSQSRITRGQQQTYIGGGTQQQTVSLAENGTMAMYSTFFQYITYVQQHVLNVCKLQLMSVKSKEEADAILSEESKRFWEALNDTELQIEDLLVVVRIEDSIDEQMRGEMNQVALAMAQNVDKTGFTMADWLELKTARTARELLRRFTEKQQLSEQKAMENMQMQQQTAMQQDAINKQFEANMFKLEEDNKAMRDQIRNIPSREANQIKREELDMKREMSRKSEEPVKGGL